MNIRSIGDAYLFAVVKCSHSLQPLAGPFLFVAIICSSISHADDVSNSEITSSLSIDFDGREVTEVGLGAIPAGIESIVEIKWLNKTSQTITIFSAVGSCSCLVGHLDKQVVKPGDAALLKLHARPAAYVRHLQQQLDVSMTEGESSQTRRKRLQVSAKPLPLYRVEPQFVSVLKGKSEIVELTIQSNFRDYPSNELILSSIPGKMEVLRATPSDSKNVNVFAVRVNPQTVPISSSEVLTLAFAASSDSVKQTPFSTSLELRFKNHVVFRPSQIPLNRRDAKSVGTVLLLCDVHWKKGDSFPLFHNNDSVGTGFVVDVQSRKTTLRLELETADYLSKFSPISFELPEVGRLSLNVTDEG